MSRIQLGDMVVEQGRPQAPGVSPSSPPPPPDRGPPGWVRRVASRLSTRGWLVLSAAGGLVSLLVGLLMLAPAVEALLAHGTVDGLAWAVNLTLFPAALAVAGVGLGAVRRRLDAAEALEGGSEVAPEVFLARRARLYEQLPAAMPGLELAELARRARLPEDVVVSTLAEMKRQGEVEEELNLDDGTFVYLRPSLPEARPEAPHLSIEDREARLLAARAASRDKSSH